LSFFVIFCQSFFLINGASRDKGKKKKT